MEKLYKIITLIGFTCVLLRGCPVYAQQIGEICSQSTTVVTLKSIIPTEGVIECIPDSLGHYYWQAMGAGVARYDSSNTCNLAGTLRWNGSAIQFCDGSNWQSLGGGTTLVVGGCQRDWSSCPNGYRTTSYFSPGTYNCCDRCGNPSWKYTVCSQ